MVEVIAHAVSGPEQWLGKALPELTTLASQPITLIPLYIFDTRIRRFFTIVW